MRLGTTAVCFTNHGKEEGKEDNDGYDGVNLRRADHSSRGVLPTVVRRCVWSRNIKNEEAVTRVGSQRHSKKKMMVWIIIMNILLYGSRRKTVLKLEASA